MKTKFKTGLVGALAGLAGAWPMKRFRVLWDRRRTATPESGIFGFDEEADVKSVDQLCTLFSKPALSVEEALQVAQVLHFSYGALAGAMYAIARTDRVVLRSGYGLSFGVLLWLIGDELAISAAGLSDPLRKTSASHGSALFAHLLFGAVTELSCRLLLRETL